MISTNAVKAIGTHDGLSAVNAKDHSVGSIHGFKVNLDLGNNPFADHENNFYAWKVYTIDGGTETQLADFTKFQFVTYDPKGTTTATKFGGIIGASGEYSAQKAYAVGIQWLDVLASGVYAVEVEEYNSIDASSCSARRRYYISVSNAGVDLLVEAVSKVTSGTPAETTYPDIVNVADLTSCNDNSGGLINNADETAFETSTRYFKVTMKTGNDQLWAKAWGFTYEVTGSANIENATIALEDAAAATITDDKASSVISVNPGYSSVIIAVTVDNKLGTVADAITLNFGAATGSTSGQTTAYIVSNGNQYETDEAGKVSNNKLTNSYTISASPSAGGISVD